MLSLSSGQTNVSDLGVPVSLHSWDESVYAPVAMTGIWIVPFLVDIR